MDDKLKQMQSYPLPSKISLGMFISPVFTVSKPFGVCSVALGWLKSEWVSVNKSCLTSTCQFLKGITICWVMAIAKNKQLLLMLK